MKNPFEPTRRFAILGLVLTIAVSVACSFFLSRFMVRNLLKQDAAVSMEFVQSVVEVQQARDYFIGRRSADTNLMEFFNRIASMPNVVRANVFSSERTIIWSSDPALIGRRFHDNPELEAALRGELEVSLDELKGKAEPMSETSLKGHIKGAQEDAEGSGSIPYVPPEAKDDLQLIQAMRLLRGEQANAAFPADPKKGVPN